MAAAPPLTAAALEAALISRLPASEASVSDESGGCGAAFCVARVVSAAFTGAPPLKRHRLINAALKAELEHIHALQIRKCLTPDEAAKEAAG